MATAELERKTELLPNQSPTTLAIDFEATKEQLTKLVATSGTLTVKSIDDKTGIAICRERRLELKNLRVSIEKRRKELKADSIEFGRKVDGVAKELTAIIEPEEKRLEHEENIVKRHEAKLAEEKAQLEKEAEERRQATTRERLRLLQECGKSYLADDVHHMTDDDFAQLLAAEQADKKARDEQAAADAAERKRIEEANRVESERLAKEKAEHDRHKAEAETRIKCMQARVTLLANCGFASSRTSDELADMPTDEWELLIKMARDEKQARDDDAAAERAEIDRVKAEQAEAQAKIDAENNRILASSRRAELEGLMPTEYDPEIRRMLNQAGLLVDGPELAELSDDEFCDHSNKVLAIVMGRAAIKEQARLDAIAEQERIEKELIEAAEAEAAELARLEARRPDVEKLLAVAASLEAFEVPEVSQAAAGARIDVINALRYAARDIRATCEDLVMAK